jgi:hypothetical protein
LLSEDAKSMADRLRNLMLFTIENKQMIDFLNTAGVAFNPLPENVVIESKEDVDEYMDTTYKSLGAIVAERIAEETLKTNRYNVIKVKEFINLLVCGRTAVDRVIKNGKVVEEVVHPSEIISDLRMINDNNFNDAARFRGRFRQFVSPAQVLEEYGEYLDSEAIEEIKMMSESTNNKAFINFSSNNIAAPYGSNYGFYSLASSTDAPITNLSVVKMYVILEFDPRYKEKKGYVAKIKDYDKKGNLIDDNAMVKGIACNYRIAQCTMIGGKYLVQKGWVANAIYENYPMVAQKFPMSMYLDNYNNGIYKSRVSRMREYLKDIWLCDTRIKQAMESDLGLNFFIKYFGAESESPNGQTIVQRIYSEFKSQHLSSIKIDPDDPSEGNRQFVEMIDYTKALSVIPIYQQVKDTCFNELQAMMHLPEIAQGLQERRIGKGEQQQTMAAASVGLLPLLNGFIHYIQEGLQITCNMQKLVYVADNFNEDYARRILGDSGYEWLKTSVFESFEMFGIYINPYNVIDDGKRAILDGKLQAYAQGGVIDPLVDLKLSQIKNYREAINYLTRYFKKKEADAKALAEQTRKDAMANEQADREVELQSKQFAPQALMQSTQMKTDATKYQADKSQETKIHDTNTMANVKLATHETKQ